MDEDPIAAVLRLHADVDAQTRPLRARHAARLQCRLGCSSCCLDELTVFEIEADVIRAHAADVLRTPPHPAGACAFLDAQGACRIYALRPYVCRTQGLPLRWVDFDAPDAAIERRDICPLNETKEPLEALPAAACWTLGASEARLAQLQADRDGGALRRIRLRALFGPCG